MYHVSSFDHRGLLIDFSPVNIEGYPSMFCPHPGGAPPTRRCSWPGWGSPPGSSAKWARMTLASP